VWAHPPSVPGCRLADYLEQHGRRARGEVIPPVSFWDAAAGHAAPGDLAALARAAEKRGLFRHATLLYKKAEQNWSVCASLSRRSAPVVRRNNRQAVPLPVGTIQ
jgi:hypothetical protein